MCGRYILVQKIEVLEKRFNVTVPADFDFKPSYNISPGKYAPVITSENPRELQLFQFGMTPFWAKKKMYLFNARAEGDKNKGNSRDYHGGKDIIIKPAFRKPIRSQRCLIPPVFVTFLQHPHKVLIINDKLLSLGVANSKTCILESLKTGLEALAFR